MDGRCIDIKPICDSFEVVSVFKDSIYEPDYDKLMTLGNRLSADDSEVLGYEENGLILGGIAYEISGNLAVIKYISTDGGHRHRGIGSFLIESAFSGFDGVVEAETDSDAAGFYEKCGFEVTDLGELYPGIERFKCKKVFKNNKGEN